MTVERLTVSGGWLISDIVDNQLIRRRYFGYTKREAIARFKQEIKELSKK